MKTDTQSLRSRAALAKIGKRRDEGYDFLDFAPELFLDDYSADSQAADRVERRNELNELDRQIHNAVLSPPATIWTIARLLRLLVNYAVRAEQRICEARIEAARHRETDRAEIDRLERRLARLETQNGKVAA